MADKRVQDVSGDYDDRSAAMGDADIHRIRRQATPLATGKLERDVDAILHAKGAALDEPLGSKALRGVRPGRIGLRRTRS